MRPVDRVALFLENSPDVLAAYLGTHLAAGVVVPVSSQYRRTKLLHILGDAGVRLCFTDRDRRPEVDRVRGDLPDLEAVIGAGPGLEDFLSGADDHEQRLPGSEDLAGYKKPRQVVFVDTLPRNALGKVQKHRAREQIIGPEE